MNSSMKGQNEVFRKKRKNRSANQQFLRSLKRNQKFSTDDHGTSLEQVDYEYFSRVFMMTRSFEGSTEEKVVFANNSLAQTENKEVECSSNQLTSRVIETLLPVADDEVLERFLSVFLKNLRPICNNKYASHVLQTLMIVATKRSQQESESQDEFRKRVLEVCKFLLNNIEEYISETYANPVLRTALHCLAGAPHLSKTSTYLVNTFIKGISEPETTTKPPKEFAFLLKEFSTRISNWPQFKDFVASPLQSGYLQHLLSTLHIVNQKEYVVLQEKILTQCFFSNNNNTNMSSPTALPVLEVIIEKSDQNQLKTLYKNLLAGRISDMLTVKTAYFTLVKFLDQCEDSELVEEVVLEILPHFNKILSNNQHVLLTSLSGACMRSKSAQSQFERALVDVLNCEDSKDKLARAALTLTPLPHSTPAPKTTKFGSILVQNLLKFQKPIKIVKSLLSFGKEELASFLASDYGCFITKAFCQSESIGEKSRQKLIQHLKGNFPELARSKHGSRSFEDIWDIADYKNREAMVKELSLSTSKVMGSMYGKIVASKVQLQNYTVLGFDKWRTILNRDEHNKKLFRPIVGEKRKINTLCDQSIKNISETKTEDTDQKKAKRFKKSEEDIKENCSDTAANLKSSKSKLKQKLMKTKLKSGKKTKSSTKCDEGNIIKGSWIVENRKITSKSN